MISVQAKKSKGIEDLLNSLSTAVPDEIRKVERKYNPYASLLQCFDGAVDIEESHEFIDEQVKEVLLPAQCNQFLQLLVKCRDDEKYQWPYMWQGTVGEFMTKLLQNSYDAGFNNFDLHLPKINDEYDAIGWGLTGTERDPIKLKLRGTIGGLFAMGARYLSVNVQGNVVGSDGVACRLQNSDLTIKGDVNTSFASDEAAYCTFTIYGAIKQQPRSFIGPFGAGAENCTFRTNKKPTLIRFLEDIPAGNKIYFIHKDGTEELIRKR